MHCDDKFESRKSSYERYWHKKWQPRYQAHAKGLNSKVDLVTNAKGSVIKIIVTDCKADFALIKNIKTDVLIANRAYDTGDIVEYAKNNGIEIVIFPKFKRKLKKP